MLTMKIHRNDQLPLDVFEHRHLHGPRTSECQLAMKLLEEGDAYNFVKISLKDFPRAESRVKSWWTDHRIDYLDRSLLFKKREEDGLKFLYVYVLDKDRAIN